MELLSRSSILKLFLLSFVLLNANLANVLNSMTILTYKNDKIELDCSLHNFSTSFGNETVQNSSDVDLNLVLFKKDNILIQIKNSSIKLQIKNSSDEGLYECGYYHLYRYGEFIYFANAKWLVKIINGKNIEI